MRIKREKLQNEISLIRATKLGNLGFDTKNTERNYVVRPVRPAEPSPPNMPSPLNPNRTLRYHVIYGLEASRILGVEPP